MDIDRCFVRISEGLVHYRHCGESARPPLYMIHASPMSALPLVPLMRALGQSRRVIAPDTLGYGDSAPPALEVPDMAYYADSVGRVLDALGIDKVDLYGSHTGAHIACEFAIRNPARVGKVVFDGIGAFSPEDKEEFVAKYAPEIAPADDGTHLLRAWDWTRNGMLYFPHFRHTPGARRDAEMPPPDVLHVMTVELLKAMTTYHKGYRAAFRHADRERLPLIPHPTFCMASEDDILKDAVPRAAAFIKNCVSGLLPSERTTEGLHAKAKAIADFIDA